MNQRQFIFPTLLTISMSMTAQTFTIKVENNWDRDKIDEPVVINLHEIGLKESQLRTIQSANISNMSVYQLDDLDGDTYADELVFLTDIKAGETQEYTISLSAKQMTEMPNTRTYADLLLEDKKSKYPKITSIEAPGESYLYNDLYHHGAAWENELTAYRIYFDQRQNIDIYGKKLQRLELADTHFYTTPQQMQQDYGNDVLWAGNSVGCGSFKGYNDGPVNIEPVKTRSQRIVATGPIRTIVEVKDKGWQYPDATNRLNMTQLYIQYAGHRETEVRISFDSPLGNETFCTGAQKYGSNSISMVLQDGLAATWGSDYPEMGKKEQFPPEFVGLGVYVPKEFVKQYKEDDLNHLFVIQAKGKTSFNYYVTFAADKEQSGFHSAQTWFASLTPWRDNLQHPVKVTKKK